MFKKGFTLIELLIVITIIAILAGAALPYIRQYVDDSRYSKAKSDLEEIRNALIRYENDKGKPYDSDTINALVGPYLMKNLIDPWGTAYAIATASSKCYSLGPDAVDNSGDEVSVDYRPPLALSKVYWEDTNNDGTVSTGDYITLKFTRPLDVTGGPTLTVANDDLVYSAGAPANDYTDKQYSNYNMTVKMQLDFGANTPFKTGQDSISIKAGSSIVDPSGNLCKSGQEAIIKAR